MATGQKVPGSSFDASSRSKEKGIPKFVTVSTGEFETNEDGSLIYDDDGEPIERTKRLIVKRSGEALKSIIMMGDDEPLYERGEDGEIVLDENGEKKVARGQAGKNIDQLYMGLASLLRDPDNNLAEVDAEWLSNVLDFDVANEWMEKLVPSGGGAEGNASDSETDSSTSTSMPEPAAPISEESSRASSISSTGTKAPISPTGS